uniref:Uncharacterized protein n=1 Tax=Biomphalaria glabrata TaxID=6526 RepID=A0A2C9M340_BIOGL
MDSHDVIRIMGLPVGFSVVHCIGTVLLGIGLILHIVGLATPSWASGTRTDSRGVSVTIMFGLWKVCFGPECKDLSDYSTNITGPDTTERDSICTGSSKLESVKSGPYGVSPENADHILQNCSLPRGPYKTLAPKHLNR